MLSTVIVIIADFVIVHRHVSSSKNSPSYQWWLTWQATFSTGALQYFEMMFASSSVSQVIQLETSIIAVLVFF